MERRPIHTSIEDGVAAHVRGCLLSRVDRVSATTEFTLEEGLLKTQNPASPVRPVGSAF